MCAFKLVFWLYNLIEIAGWLRANDNNWRRVLSLILNGSENDRAKIEPPSHKAPKTQIKLVQRFKL